MASNERIKKYLEAGTVLGQVTRARAEEIVRELVSAGDIQRGQAQEWVDNLVDRSRKTSEQVLELVRHEVSNQLSKIDAPSLEAIAGQVADILKRSAEAGRAATHDAGKQATKTAKAARDAAKKVTPSGRKKKKAPAKKAAAKKAPAKKAAAKKAPAKKTAAKKAPAKKAGPGRSGS
jgi:polyhydroxyalkanoate synthesis regulator phasin